MGVGVIEWGWRSEGDIAREEERVLAFIYELEGKSIRLVSWFKMMCVGGGEREPTGMPTSQHRPSIVKTKPGSMAW